MTEDSTPRDEHGKPETPGAAGAGGDPADVWAEATSTGGT
ncbi:MAG: hypothetical protein QOC67_2073, partial [Pseudonocardiales bacterium]|nr:hypothetical protein [Pseudonocardiales bacterium]